MKFNYSENWGYKDGKACLVVAVSTTDDVATVRAYVDEDRVNPKNTPGIRSGLERMAELAWRKP